MSATPVAITIPVYRDRLGELDEFSLARCIEVLGHYPIVFFGPESLGYSVYLGRAGSASVVRFPDRCFRSIETYSELLLSSDFYKALSHYEFILIYQLDAFVFQDDLEYWCSQGYDYIGAPWWDERMGWMGVGNGGFCLRRPASCLKVLNSRYKEDPAVFWAHVRRFTPNPVIRAAKYHHKLARHLRIGSTVDHFLRRFIHRGCSEDQFWGYAAVRYCPEFRLAPVEDAIRFAVEGGLKEASAHYGQRPPFGCHQLRYLRMIRRFLQNSEPPASWDEAQAWDLAGKAGLGRPIEAR